MVQHSHSHPPSAVGEHTDPVPEEVDSRMAVVAAVLHLVEGDTLQDCMVQVDSAGEQGPILEVGGTSWSEDNGGLLHMAQRLLVEAVAYTDLDHTDLRTGHSPHRFHVLPKR